MQSVISILMIITFILFIQVLEFYKEKDKDSKNHVYVKNLKTEEITKALVEKEDLIRNYG